MQKIIVTGGAGFIGSHLVDALVIEGHEVHIVDNMFSGEDTNLNPKAVFHRADIRDVDSLKDIFQGATYVFHQAAIPQVQYSLENPVETHDINVTGLLNVLEAARITGVQRVILASSSAIYGDPERLPQVETMEPKPLSPYGAHKYINEVYCKLWSTVYGVETVCLRYFNVYGPRQSVSSAYPCVIAKFVDLAHNSKPLTITGDGTQTRSFIHVSDVVSANIAAMQSSNVGKGEVINIGTMDMYSVNTIAQLVGGEVVFVDKRIEPSATQADVSKAKELLGWEPKIGLEQGLEELKKYITI